MDLNIEDIWTEKDGNIKIDFSFDPLGVMVIWRLYAQEIFGNKITTVANDMKHYLINLFNLTTIRILYQDDFFKQKFQEIYGGNDKAFRDDMLIFLENLFIWSFSENQDSASVPGMSKFKSIKDNRNYLIAFEGKPEKYEILARQVQLGISGRYKTPFKFMGFDYDKIFIGNNGEQHWSNAQELIWNNYSEIISKISSFLKNHGFKEPVEYKKIPSEICNLIKNNFAQKASIPENLVDFLLDRLGLTNGTTAYSLYEIAKNNKGKKTSEIFSTAIDNHKDNKKLQDIISLENFLAPLQHIFDSLIETKNTKVSDYSNLSNKFPNPYPEISEEILKKSETAKIRFEKLNKICNSKNKIKELIKYHKFVQEERGSPPWIDLDSSGKLKKIKYESRENINSWLDKNHNKIVNKWKNDYYISSLKNILDTIGEQ